MIIMMPPLSLQTLKLLPLGIVMYNFMVRSAGAGCSCLLRTICLHGCMRGAPAMACLFRPRPAIRGCRPCVPLNHWPAWHADSHCPIPRPSSPPPGAAMQMHEVQSGLNKTEFKAEGYTDVEEGAPHNLEEAWAIYAGEH